MTTTLRELILRQGARLQGRPALTAPGWGTLSHAQLRQRVEGLAMGLLAVRPALPVFSATGTAWDWAAELAAAACGLPWDPGAPPVPPDLLGGPAFHAEAGRGPFHERERLVGPGTLFQGALTHGELLARLRRLNVRLGWDHETALALPLPRLGEPGCRAILWSALYAGGHLVLAGPGAAADPDLTTVQPEAPDFGTLWA